MKQLTKAYFDRKMRVGKLDSGLLFLSSSVGIVFAIIRALTPSNVSVLYSLPLILFGVITPFYYGYFLGAIVHNSAIDRVRGWVFFLLGIGAYVYSLTTTWLQTVLTLSFGGIYASAVPAVIGGLIFLLFAIKWGPKFLDFMFNTIGQARSILSDLSVRFCAGAAFFFAWGLAGLSTQVSDFSYAVLLIPVAFGLFSLYMSERYARRSRVA
jgi:hypothetical protein